MMEWTKLTSTHPRQCVLGKRSGVDLGGGGVAVADASPSNLRNSILSRTKGSLLCIILRNTYLVMEPKNFLKVPSALINTYFEGGARPEKAQFFGQNFPKKSLKMPFLACF